MSTQFNVGQTYSTRSICDHDCIISLTVASRTAKTITTVDKHGKRQTLRPRLIDGIESVQPWGRYSMSPIVQADDKDLTVRA